MDGSREAGAGLRRTVRVLRKIYDKDARRFGEPPVDCRSSPSKAQPRVVPWPEAADGAAGASAPAQIVASPATSQQNTDLRLGRGELTVLLEDRPVTDAGIDFFMSDLIEMRTSDLVGVLSSMGQAVGKRRPTRLELLGGVVTLLCDIGRLRL